MDPLSVAVGCMSLLGSITTVSIQISSFVSGVRDARSDMDAVSRELVSLKLCPEALRDDSRKTKYPDGFEDNLKAVLANCDLVVAEIGDLIQKLGSANAVRRIQWTVAGRTEMNKLRSSLESHKSALEIALDITAILILSSLKDDTQYIKTQNEEIRDGIAQLPAIYKDTSQIASLVDEISLLRAQISNLKQSDKKKGLLLQSFLDESISYAESMTNFDANEFVIQEPPNSEDGARLDFSPPTTIGESEATAFDETRMVHRTESPQIDVDFESSDKTKSGTQRTRPPMMKRLLRDTDREAIKAAEAARAALSLRQRDLIDRQLRVSIRGRRKGRTPEFLILKPGELASLQEIRAMLDAGADSRKSFLKSDALKLEIQNAKRQEVIELLLSRDADPNGGKIFLAIAQGDTDTLELVLEYGANPNYRDNDEFSALSRAAEGGCERMRRALLGHRADIHDSRDGRSSKALYIACELGHVQVVEALLEGGAKIELPVWRADWELKPEVKELMEKKSGYYTWEKK